MRLKRQLLLTLSTDTAGEQVLAKRDQSITDDTLTMTDCGSRSIPAATTVQIDLGGVTAVKAVLIEFAAAVKVRFAADDDGVPLALVSAGQTGVFYAEVSATVLYIENESATAAVNIYVAVAGT